MEVQQEKERRAIINEIHAPARRRFPTKSIVLKGVNDLWQADLVDLSPHARVNKQHKYILTVINCFTKEAYAIPLKTKSGDDVAKAFGSILKEVPPPLNLQVDKGKEFYNKSFKQLMRKYGINMYSTSSYTKAAIVERFNRTLKSEMFKQFHMHGSYNWVNLLQPIVDKYNNTKHRTIGMKPVDVRRSRNAILHLLQTAYRRPVVKKPGKFKIGNIVRISKLKRLFEKGYLANWTTELFRVTSVLNTTPRTYLLSDMDGEPISGSFYEEELQLTKFPDTYLVEKIIKRKGDKALVKWLGFTTPTWIPSTNVL